MPFREEEDDYEASSELAALVDGGALEIYSGGAPVRNRVKRWCQEVQCHVWVFVGDIYIYMYIYIYRTSFHGIVSHL
jgi:TusA-related sulfurtransferase